MEHKHEVRFAKSDPETLPTMDEQVLRAVEEHMPTLEFHPTAFTLDALSAAGSSVCDPRTRHRHGDVRRRRAGR